MQQQQSELLSIFESESLKKVWNAAKKCFKVSQNLINITEVSVWSKIEQNLEFQVQILEQFQPLKLFPS